MRARDRRLAGASATGCRSSSCSPATDEDAPVGHLGPDLLGPDWDLAEAVRRLAAHPDREIGEALLDQRNLAGIGNLYKAESLFLRGVDPWTPVARRARPAAARRAAARLLRANRRPPHSHDRRQPARPGALGVRAARQALPAVRHPHPVGRQGPPPYDRLTYWCPTCQR